VAIIEVDTSRRGEILKTLGVHASANAQNSPISFPQVVTEIAHDPDSGRSLLVIPEESLPKLSSVGITYDDVQEEQLNKLLSPEELLEILSDKMLQVMNIKLPTLTFIADFYFSSSDQAKIEELMHQHNVEILFADLNEVTTLSFALCLTISANSITREDRVGHTIKAHKHNYESFTKKLEMLVENGSINKCHVIVLRDPDNACPL
jgi:hypothetical protein